jgi:uncharacterized damage-inducible protein DinB
MESKIMESATAKPNSLFMTTEAFRKHWQGHRRLTRRVIEVYPEDKLFTHSIGGMRPFGLLVMELIHIAAPGVKGIVTRQWSTFQEVEKAYPTPKSKEELLRMWDRSTEQIDSLWPHITEERLQEVDKIFDQWEGPVRWGLLYFIDNEIHHRGQGYVYLRSLGIEPPPFWDRKDPD